jgi:hypothetical protein
LSSIGDPVATWVAQDVPALHGYCVEWAEPGHLLLSRRDRLYRAAGLNAQPVPLAGYPTPFHRRFPARLRLAQRLLRFWYYNVLPIGNNQHFTTFDRSCAVLQGNKFSFINGLDRKFRVLRGGCALTPDGSVYFGEYFGNERRERVRIFHVDPKSQQARAVVTFAPGEIRHVHGVFYDRFADALWCTTGDGSSECRILRSTNRWESYDVVGAGDETWRAVSLAFTEEAIYYATDAEFMPNHIYRISRDSGRREQLAEVGGPVYYSGVMPSAIAFGVTAELAPSQKTPEASVWRVEGKTAQRIYSVRKDGWPVKYFLAGTLYFPLGPGLPEGLLVHLVATERDNRTLLLRRA